MKALKKIYPYVIPRQCREKESQYILIWIFFVALGLSLVYFLSVGERQNLTVTENYSVSEVFVFVRPMYREAREVLKGF